MTTAHKILMEKVFYATEKKWSLFTFQRCESLLYDPSNAKTFNLSNQIYTKMNARKKMTQRRSKRNPKQRTHKKKIWFCNAISMLINRIYSKSCFSKGIEFIGWYPVLCLIGWLVNFKFLDIFRHMIAQTILW